MAEIKYTKGQIKKLLGNKYVKNCSNKNITFTKEFKIKLLEESSKGVFYKDIFKKFGFPEYIINSEIPRNSLNRWKKNINIKGVINTINEAKNNFNLKGAIIQSDQGFHYTHPNYIKILRDSGIIQSMSRKGNCLDNAPTESFFGHMKDEIDLKQIKSYNELVKYIDNYIFYYNNNHPQWNKKKNDSCCLQESFNKNITFFYSTLLKWIHFNFSSVFFVFFLKN